MTKIVVFETLGTKIKEFKRDPRGKAQKIIPWGNWKGDRQKLNKEAEKHKDTGGNELEDRSHRT